MTLVRRRTLLGGLLGAGSAATAACTERGSEGPTSSPTTDVDSATEGSDPVTDAEPETPGQLTGEGLALLPDSGVLAATMTEGKVGLWSLDSGTIEQTWSVPGAGALAVTPDGKRLAVATSKGSIEIVDVSTITATPSITSLTPPEDDPRPIVDLAFSPDGSLLASASSANDVLMWDVSSRTADTLVVGGSQRKALAFSTDGTQLAVAGLIGPVQIVDVAKGAVTSALSESPAQGYALAFSPDGTWLATTSRTSPKPGKVLLFAVDGFALEETHPDQLEPLAMAFSPDSETLALTDSASRAVVLWSSADGRSRRLSGHSTKPRAVLWSEDGSLVYSASESDGIIEWDASTGKEKRRLTP